MNAFDTAWALVKAPLDFDSIRDMGDVEDKDIDYRVLEADFIDPESDERLRAKARMSDDGYGFGRIYDNDYPDEARAFAIMSSTGQPKMTYPYSIGTTNYYQGRGYQEAIFQLLADLLDRKGMKYWEPSSGMKTGDGHMFARRMHEKHGDDEKMQRVVTDDSNPQ
tara:strand:- start:73 stop:567 length:495 start_codon:yes stop_codon:yes gene_type:complete